MKKKATKKPAAADDPAEDAVEETGTTEDQSLDWEAPETDAGGAQSDDDTGEPAAEPQPLTRAQINDLPNVEESVIAQNLPPNCPCRLTPGCTGRIKTYSTFKRRERDPKTGKAVALITEQYVKCYTCNRTPVNPRRLTQNLVDRKLYDRHAVKRED